MYFLPRDYSALNCLLGMTKWKKGGKKTKNNNALTHGGKVNHSKRRGAKASEKKTGISDAKRGMTVYASLCHSRFMLAARFEESEKGIKKRKGLGEKQAAGRWCWFILVSGNCHGCRCGGKTEINQEFRWHRNIQMTSFGVCVCVCAGSVHTCREQTRRSQLGDRADVAWVTVDPNNNHFDIVVEKRCHMEEWRDWQVRWAGLVLFPSLNGLSLYQDGRNQTHRWEDLAVPCSGRMLTLKSSSWLRALMRSSSSWMAWGQSVISWRHALEKRKTRECGQ